VGFQKISPKSLAHRFFKIPGGGVDKRRMSNKETKWHAKVDGLLKRDWGRNGIGGSV